MIEMVEKVIDDAGKLELLEDAILEIEVDYFLRVYAMLLENKKSSSYKRKIAELEYCQGRSRRSRVRYG